MRNIVSLSIITLTKNRAQLLERCLVSLKGQLFVTDEIIVVDNNSTDNTQQVIFKYQKELPIHPYETKLSGFSSLYNLAISKSKHDIVVFLDDDCVATPSFLSQIRARFSTRWDFVLQGKTIGLPRNNIFAEISEDHLANWMTSNMVGKDKLRVIDNRNVAIPKSILKRVGGFSTKMNIGSEDVELGTRLFNMGIPIYYDTSMIAYHHERTTLRKFLSQHYRIAQSHAVFDEKFPDKQNISILNKRTFMRHVISGLRREWWYLCNKRHRDAFLLPTVFLLLFVVRMAGYLKGMHAFSQVTQAHEQGS